jgi:major membrane immunogen (membrane-anchored lipoprotein)
MQKAPIFIIMILLFACSKENNSNYELPDGCYVINFNNIKAEYSSTPTERLYNKTL